MSGSLYPGSRLKKEMVSYGPYKLNWILERPYAFLPYWRSPDFAFYALWPSRNLIELPMKSRYRILRKLWRAIEPKLRAFTIYSVKIHPTIEYYSPLLRLGWEARAYSNYWIKAAPYDAIFGNYSSQLKNHLRDSEHDTVLTCNDAWSDLALLIHEKQNKINSFGFWTSDKLSYLKNLGVSKSGCIAMSVRRNDRPIAAGMVIEESDFMYLLLSINHPKQGTRSGLSKLIDASINLASLKNKDYYFDGSIIANVEKRFQAFGPSTFQRIVLRKSVLGSLKNKLL